MASLAGSIQCANNAKDRALGIYWERCFCDIAADHGFVLTALQIGRGESATWHSKTGKQWSTYVLPDITVWTCPGQHHEIKHKNPTSHESFGLEQYRFAALLAFAQVTQQDVLYTIHNHDLSGGREARGNALEHWLTANILELDRRWTFSGKTSSWVNGQRRDGIPIYYWSSSMWQPLGEYWAAMARRRIVADSPLWNHAGG